MASLNMITLDMSKSIKLVSENLIKLVSSIGGLAENCIHGRNTLFISIADSRCNEEAIKFIFQCS